jgi:hypothetical protein
MRKTLNRNKIPKVEWTTEGTASLLTNRPTNDNSYKPFNINYLFRYSKVLNSRSSALLRQGIVLAKIVS